METAKILIVEDDQSLRNLYNDILTEAGYKVDTAKDGQIGLEKIQQGGWDLILLDIILPVINGLEIMRQVKQHPPKVPNGPVIFSTNLYEDAQYKEAMTLGNGYLIKSNVTPDVFEKEVRKYLELSHPKNT